jgi:hypothetical protein
LSYRNKSEEGDRFEAFIRGIETVLIENHIPHDFIADDQISQQKLANYKLIILPNVKCLSDNEITLLKAYVANGGNLLSTYETSLFNENGLKRADFGLSEVFGCQFTGEKVNTRKDFYQFILDKDHAIVKPDSKETDLLINAGFTLICNAGAATRKICTYVPVVHNQPPEKAWTTSWAKENPTVLENTYQKGKSIYFSNQPDLITFEFGHPDMRNLLLRAVRYLAGDSIAVDTNAPESVHIGLTRSNENSNEFIFSLVNTTSGPVRPLRNILPVYNLTTTLNLKSALSNFKILRAGSEAQVNYANNRVEIKLSRLDDFFAVHLTMKS